MCLGERWNSTGHFDVTLSLLVTKGVASLCADGILAMDRRSEERVEVPNRGLHAFRTSSYGCDKRSMFQPGLS